MRGFSLSKTVIFDIFDLQREIETREFKSPTKVNALKVVVFLYVWTS